MGLDFAVIAPLLPSLCDFSFVFGCGVSFLVNSSVFLSRIVQQLLVILVFSQEGVRACHSTLPSQSIYFLQAYLVLLCFTLLNLADVFFTYCGSPASGKSVGAIFPITFAHFLSLCHVLVVLSIFQTFPLLLYLLWWSVISDFWCYYCKNMTCWRLRWTFF